MIAAATSQILVHTTVSGGGVVVTGLAVLGVVLSVVALIWQAVSFWLSGSRIRVEIRMGATDGARAVTQARAQTQDEVQSLIRMGMTQPVLGIQVTNSGRAPTSVQSVDVLFPNGAVVTGAYLLGAQQLPFRMEAESEQTWLVDARLVANAARAFEQVTPTGQPWAVRGQVKVGGKKKPAISKNDVRIL